jgi:hypothetical protein
MIPLISCSSFWILWYEELVLFIREVLSSIMFTPSLHPAASRIATKLVSFLNSIFPEFSNTISANQYRNYSEFSSLYCNIICRLCGTSYCFAYRVINVSLGIIYAHKGCLSYVLEGCLTTAVSIRAWSSDS